MDSRCRLPSLRWLVFLGALFSTLTLTAPLDAQGDQLAELAGQVQEVLVRRCASCHGSDVRRPKGGFGYVDDIRRVAEDYVEATSLEEADLWYWIAEAEDRMPPSKSKTGPLTLEETGLIRWWIQAGAPTRMPGREPSVAKPIVEAEDVAWLALAHPLLVHFPIALVLLATLMEFLALVGLIKSLGAIRLVLVLAAVSTVLTAFSGASLGAGAGARVEGHEQAGWITLGCVLAATILRELAQRSPRWIWPARLMLLVAAVAVSWTAHLGGTLVWPEHWN